MFSGFSLVISERNVCERWTGPVLCRLEELHGDCMTLTADVAMWTLALKLPKWCHMASGPSLNCETAPKKGPSSIAKVMGTLAPCIVLISLQWVALLFWIPFTISYQRDSSSHVEEKKTVFTAAQMISDSWSVTRELDPPFPHLSLVFVCHVRLLTLTPNVDSSAPVWAMALIAINGLWLAYILPWGHCFRTWND